VWPTHTGLDLVFSELSQTRVALHVPHGPLSGHGPDFHSLSEGEAPIPQLALTTIPFAPKVTRLPTFTGSRRAGPQRLDRFSVSSWALDGAQAGAARLDIGPRLSMRVFPGIRTHLDCRYRLLGRAEPGSGYAVTVAWDC
jgi:hypothetical protein